VTSAKGLRHGFAIAALEKNVPLNIVSRWLGHSNLQTTTIYAAFTGAEERGLAARMWT
jgi:integrase/recombinase XerD